MLLLLNSCRDCRAIKIPGKNDEFEYRIQLELRMFTRLLIALKVVQSTENYDVWYILRSF